MPKMRFSYEEVCAVIQETIRAYNPAEDPNFEILKDPKYMALIQSSVRGSLATSATEEFIRKFGNKPDTAATQLDIYAALCGDVCDRLRRGVSRLEPRIDKNTQQKLMYIVRIAYATVPAVTKAASLEGSENSLFVDFLRDYFFFDLLPNSPKKSKSYRANKMVRATRQFFDRFQVTDYLEEKGFLKQLATNLEAML